MQDHVTRALEDVRAAGLQYAWQLMRSRANSGPHFRLASLPRFTCKQREKRRGWDSNPRDGLTPSTRFPIALLRPTRTPLRERRMEFTKMRIRCYRRHEPILWVGRRRRRPSPYPPPEPVSVG